MSRPSLFVVLLSALLLGACASGPAAMIDTLRDGFFPGHTSAGALDPNMQFLRVTRGGRAALMALGYVEPHPEGPIEVWYSGLREVLRLQNGRVVGAVGMAEEWREVRLPTLPDWQALSDAPREVHFRRQRDVFPGYRVGVEDDLLLRPIDPPRGNQLQGLDAADLRWFEETRVAPAAEKLPHHLDLPPARYAFSMKTPVRVVYGEQCLSRTLCFTWQRWPQQRGAGDSP